jgi:hypothetical protein
MLDWLKDVKQVDETAKWAWRFLQPIFVGNVVGDADQEELDQAVPVGIPDPSIIS